jgi:bifunctional DNA-binding transcriptional regulator/antitoxin component of YhaV-PrlF toxin-antitoxin module
MSKMVWAEVNAEGHLVFPDGIAARWGLKPGARVRLGEDTSARRMHRSITQLNKLYLEPTDMRNLRRAPFAADVNCSTATKRIVWEIRFQYAAVVCGRKV